jgi:hypothetical protein
VADVIERLYALVRRAAAQAHHTIQRWIGRVTVGGPEGAIERQTTVTVWVWRSARMVQVKEIPADEWCLVTAVRK